MVRSSTVAVTVTPVRSLKSRGSIRARSAQKKQLQRYAWTSRLFAHRAPLVAHSVVSRWAVLVGVLYVAAALYASTRFLSTSADVLANDFFWALFNASSSGVFLANAFNTVLQNGAVGSTTMQLTNATFAYAGDTAISLTTIPFSSHYARQLQYHRLTTIEDGIIGMRRTSVVRAPFVFTQYCWVDLDRRWSVAHTAERADRCQRSYTTNGAVYLETMLRNIDWTDFQTVWGRYFEAGLGAPLRALPGGADFLDGLSRNGSSAGANATLVADEAAYWRRKGVTHYKLQYHNRWQVGGDEKIEIVNAFGIRNVFTVKKIDHVDRSSAVTTLKMSWGPVNDLWAVVDNNTAISGSSLVRNSTDFYGRRNLTFENVLIADGEVLSPLTPQDKLWRATVGPFGSIDMYWLHFPSELADLVVAVREIVLTAAISSADAETAYLAISPSSIMVVDPHAWRNHNWTFMGGNPLCSHTAAVSYVVQQFKFDDGCSSTITEQWAIDRFAFVFTYLVSPVTSGANHSRDLAMVCNAGTVDVDLCTTGFTNARVFANAFLSQPDRQRIQQLAARARLAAVDMNISLMQYAQRPVVDDRGANGTLERALLAMNILPTEIEATSDAWDVFGWLYLLEWATGKREVVSFQGDTSTLTLISAMSGATKISVNVAEVPRSNAIYLRVGVQYVTVVLSITAAFVLLYAVANRFEIAGWNLLQFNSVSGVVWVGRPLLFLRGVVAISILSTSSPVLVENGVLAYMTAPTQSWFTSLITASEATWLLCVAVDLGLLVIRGRTRFLAPLSQFVVWTAVAVLQWVSPTQHAMVVYPQCNFVALDSQIECVSGSVHVGFYSRFVTIVVITAVVLVVCYVIVHILRPCELLRHDGLILPGIAQEKFVRNDWIIDDEWYVDRASAFMAGLVSWRSHVVDVKAWSVLDLRPSNDTHKPSHVRRAICLRRLRAKIGSTGDTEQDE